MGQCEWGSMFGAVCVDLNVCPSMHAPVCMAQYAWGGMIHSLYCLLIITLAVGRSDLQTLTVLTALTRERKVIRYTFITS